MSLHAVPLVRAGVRRVTRPAGGVLLVAFLVAFGLVNASVNTLLTAVAGAALPGGVVVAEYGVVLPTHPFVALPTLLVGIASLPVVVAVGIRVVGDDGDGRWRDPTRCLTERTLPVAGRVAVAIALGGLAVVAGTVMLVVPGVVAAAYLLVVPGVVALEGVDPIEAVHRTTKRLTRGRALALAGATALLTVVAVAVVAAASFSYLLRPSTEFALGVLVGSALAVCWVGVAAEAHARLGGNTRPSANRTPRSTPSSRAL